MAPVDLRVKGVIATRSGATASASRGSESGETGGGNGGAKASNVGRPPRRSVGPSISKRTPEELETFRKDGKCFKCGKEGHLSRACPNGRNAGGSSGDRKDSKKSKGGKFKKSEN